MSRTLHPPSPIVVVDDEPLILKSIDMALRFSGFNNVITCPDSRQVMDILSRQQTQVLLLDLAMPHVRGEELLSLVTSELPEIPVIIITGAVDVEVAVKCMKNGAFDYLVKPFVEERLITAVRHAVAFRDLYRENQTLKQRIISDEIEHPDMFAGIVTGNRQMLSLFKYVEAVASSPQPVLITGETGVGKELFAQAIHTLSGLKGRFLPVNVGGLDDHLFSDTLFGHARGAYTGAVEARRGMVEQTSGGTLFLDEIGDLSLTSQVKLLRLLQEKEYQPLGRDKPVQASARILTSTHRDLEELLMRKEFRKDLFYRLRTHHIHIPPLRERMDDVPLLVTHFLDEAAATLNKMKPEPSPEMLQILAAHSFPGNVRELKTLIFDAVARSNAKTLAHDHLTPHIASEVGEGHKALRGEMEPGNTPPFAFSVKLPTIRQATEALVLEAMKRAAGNQTVAARLLGISQQALSKRLKKQEM
jgi:DNA-binding NtrC family response regulator